MARHLGAEGKRYGYADYWTYAGVFRLFDEGQVGDMEFARDNRGI